MKRFLVLVLLVACAPKTWRWPVGSGEVVVQRETIVRTEFDGTTSVTVFERLHDRVAAGVVWLRGIDLRSAAASPHVVLAHARAWQALAVMLADTPDQAFEAAARGAELLAVDTNGDSADFERRAFHERSRDTPYAARLLRDVLWFRLRAYVQRHRDVVVSKQRDDTDNAVLANGLIARGEPDGTVSLTAMVVLDGVTAAGTVRLRKSRLESSRAWDHATVARARAWEALSLMLADPARAYEAAHAGAKEMERFEGVDGHVKRAELSSDPDTMRRVLGSQLGWYVFHHHDEVW
jgi:hypothetical protein